MIALVAILHTATVPVPIAIGRAYRSSNDLARRMLDPPAVAGAAALIGTAG